MNKRVLKIIKKPFLIFETLGHRGIFNWMDDRTYLKILYRIRMGDKLNLENPQKYTEKLQWLKLYNRDELYTDLVDKYKVKDYVGKIIGDEYVIPSYGIWDKFEDIDFSTLPETFVLKCTHDSGGVFLCKNKSELNKKTVSKKFNTYLKHNFYWGQREWPYKNIKPRITAEKLMVDDESDDLKDYKFFCFNGEPKIMFIASERNRENTETKFDFFDMDFNRLDIINGHPNSNDKISKPENFSEMLKLASILSKGIPQVRIDFYEINKKIFFGEMTFFHWSGLTKFEPQSWDYILGQYIELPKEK